MTLPSLIRLGTRPGRLALIQCEEVADALRASHPHLPVEIVKVSAGGHAREAGPEHPGEGTGYSPELDAVLAEGRLEACVHDLAHLPTVRPDAFALAAVTRRRHPFDVLLTADGRILDELEPGERVGAATPEHRAQLLAYRSDLRVVTVRGSLENRWRKLEEGACEALVLAAADVERLGWQDRVSEIFTTEVCIPTPGQGALAVEALAAAREVVKALRALDHAETRGAVLAERAFLDEVGGGVVPAGALARVEDGILVMEAVLLAPDGSESVRDEIEGPAAQAGKLGRKLARGMLAQGGREIMEGLEEGVE